MRDGLGTLGEVWDELGDPQGVLERVGVPLGRSGTGLETLPEVRDWFVDPPRMFGMGQGTV